MLTFLYLNLRLQLNLILQDKRETKDVDQKLWALTISDVVTVPPNHERAHIILHLLYQTQKNLRIDRRNRPYIYTRYVYIYIFYIQTYINAYVTGARGQ